MVKFSCFNMLCVDKQEVYKNNTTCYIVFAHKKSLCFVHCLFFCLYIGKIPHTREKFNRENSPGV